MESRTSVRLVAALVGIVWASSLLGSSAVAADQLSVKPGFNGPVQAISNPDADGTRYLGGEFTAFDAWDTGGGAMVSASTGEAGRSFPKVSLDAGSGQVFASVPDGTGGVYIGGSFNCLGPNLSGGCDGTGDFVRNNAAHIEADGTVSDWTPDPDGFVYAMELDGTVVYLGGSFSAVDEQPRNNAAAVETDGWLLDWNPNVSGSVFSLELSDGIVYLAGAFTKVGGIDRGYAAAVTRGETGGEGGGSLTPWDPVASGWVFELDVADGAVYLAGEFSSVGGEERRGLAAVGTDGTLLSWDPGLDPDFSGRALTLEVVGDTVYVGGAFSSLGGEPRSNLGAVGTTGAVMDWSPRSNGPVSNLALGADTAFVGGAFTEVEGESRSGAAAISMDDGAVQAWDPNPKGVVNNSVGSLSISGSSVYMGGYFDTVGGEQRNRLAAVNKRGVLTTWDPGAIGPAVELPTPVRDITVSGDTVYLGGDFSYVGGEIRNHLAAVGTDGALVEAFNPNPDSSVHAVDVSGNEVYLGGTFQCLGPNPSGNCDGVGDTSRVSLAAVDMSGTPTDWAPVMNGPVATLDVSGSTVYLGGQFSSAGGKTRNYAAAIGADATATSWNPNVNGEVKTLEVSGGTVYLGGTFGEVGAQPRTNIAAVGTDGNLLPWNPSPNGAIYLLDASGDMIYFSGDFSCLGPNESGSCDGPGDTQRWGGLAAAGNDGSTSSWYPEPNNTATALAAEGDAVYLGGYFDSLGMVTRNRSAAVSVTGAVLGPWPSIGQTLTANRSGSGTGTVTSTPAGIDCGTECSEVFGEVRPVTLTATPDAGSTFSGWSGACLGTGPCEVTMDQARNVTAEFTETFDLTVSKSGNGSGTVTSTPAGIACGSDCSQSYASGEVVTLTATPDAGSTFSGWSGACSGTGNCQVTMNQARSVTAQFTAADPPDPPGPTPDPPALGNLSVKGPAKVKGGKKASYKVTIRNTGGVTATGLTIKAQGKGVKASKSGGSLAASKSKTVSLPLKFKKKGKVKVTFTVTSKNAGKKTATRTVRVR